LEPLSEPLRSLLLELKLCSARDLRRCRGSVRSLTHDLPAFDSVWLDALVQIRRLTPFQSRVLASAKPDRLRIGPCLLVDRLGGGPLGETFLARPIAGHELCVVKRVNDRDGIGVSADGAARIEKLVDGLRDFAHSSCVGPHAVHTLPSPSGRGAMVLVSRFVPGPTLGELLVRRGRYSADVVSEVGRQLLDGLAALERRGLAHGDIRLANVRLTDGGVAVLLDAGVRSALDPELTVHSGLAPDRYDGVAPELIGTGRPPNAASDLYALGCLLWQLLAGRPPFPGGDPLGKIAAHQTKTIDDVRRWAPDTPPELAEQIRRLTDRDAAARPQHIADAVAAWGSPRRSGRRRLVRFLRTFSSPAETEPTERRASPLRWALLLAALFAISGVAVSLADKGARAELLDVSNRVRDWVGSRLAKQQPTTPNGDHPGSQIENAVGLPRSTQTTLPLPAPDSDGVISLKSNGPFEASKITSIGPLTIKGQRDVRPIIVVTDRPLEIAAEVVRLENVHLRRASSATAAVPTKSLLRVQCQNLNVDQCSFETHSFDVVRSRSADATPGARTFDELPVALAWRVVNDRDPMGGRIEIRDTIFSGAAPAIHLASAPRQIHCDNCLKLGPGPLFHLATSPEIDTKLRAGRKVSVRLQGVTCRRSGSIIRWNLPDNWQPTSSPVLVVETNDCVLDLLPGQTALIELASAAAKPAWLRSARWTGDGSLAPADLWVAAVSQSSPPGLTQLDAKEFSIDGISNSPFRFAGDFGNSPTDSATLDWEAPRLLPNPPGIRASRLIWPLR
jgi:serine/threonine protein kinase